MSQEQEKESCTLCEFAEEKRPELVQFVYKEQGELKFDKDGLLRIIAVLGFMWFLLGYVGIDIVTQERIHLGPASIVFLGFLVVIGTFAGIGGLLVLCILLYRYIRHNAVGHYRYFFMDEKRVIHMHTSHPRDTSVLSLNWWYENKNTHTVICARIGGWRKESSLTGAARGVWRILGGRDGLKDLRITSRDWYSSEGSELVALEASDLFRLLNKHSSLGQALTRSDKSSLLIPLGRALSYLAIRAKKDTRTFARSAHGQMVREVSERALSDPRFAQFPQLLEQWRKEAEENYQREKESVPTS